MEVEDRFVREAMPHLPSIQRAAARILRSRHQADDVTQEVFLKAWVSFHRYEPGTNCRAWLFSILVCTIRHYNRKEWRYCQNLQEEEMAGVEPVGESLTDPDLLRMLNALSPTYRSAVTMVDLEHLSYRAAAERLRVPIGTIMSRLSRARKRMRTMMSAMPPEAGYSWWLNKSKDGTGKSPTLE